MNRQYPVKPNGHYNSPQIVDAEIIKPSFIEVFWRDQKGLLILILVVALVVAGYFLITGQNIQNEMLLQQKLQEASKPMAPVLQSSVSQQALPPQIVIVQLPPPQTVASVSLIKQQDEKVPCHLYDATRLKLHEPKNLPFDGFPDCDSWSKARAVELKYGADEVRHEADDLVKYVERKRNSQ